jgi:hypothetical protein
MIHVVNSLCGLAWLVCFIMIIIKQFQSGATGWGVATIISALCCGIGFLVALIWGWLNYQAPGMRNLVIIYTILTVFVVILGGINYSTGTLEIPAWQ